MSGRSLVLTLSVNAFDRPWMSAAVIPARCFLRWVVELDEGGGLGPTGPCQPGVEHGDGLVADQLDPAGSFRPEEIEEALQGGPVVPGAAHTSRPES
jgi:hypothetical protein